jgi:hypothetical protein
MPKSFKLQGTNVELKVTKWNVTINGEELEKMIHAAIGDGDEYANMTANVTIVIEELPNTLIIEASPGKDAKEDGEA